MIKYICKNISQIALKLKTKLKSNSGFSLLEVLITLFIIGLVLILYQAALGKTELIRSAKNQEIAMRVANNKMEELRAGGYAMVPSSGSFSDSQLNSLLNSSASLTVSDFNSDTKQVVVNIQWKNSLSSPLKNISLATLITKTGGL